MTPTERIERYTAARRAAGMPAVRMDHVADRYIVYGSQRSYSATEVDNAIHGMQLAVQHKGDDR